MPEYILTTFWDAKIDIFDIIEKKCDFVCFGNVSIRYNINDCVHLEITVFAKLCYAFEEKLFLLSP